MARNIYGIVPRMIVEVDDIPVRVISATMTLTNKAEPDTASIEIAMDNLDCSTFTQKGVYHSVKIYAGYLDERKDIETESIALIENKKYKSSDTMFLRFDGFLDQPEFHIGDKLTMTMHCKDIAGILCDGKFSEKKEGSATSAKAIIADINNHVKGIKITLDHADFDMGTKDSKGQKQTYAIQGKSYWDVIKDVAAKGELNIEKKGTNVIITGHKQYKDNWLMIRTNSKDEKDDWPNFSNMTWRFGGKHKGGQDILVECHCVTPGAKRGKSRAIVGRYPIDSKGWNGEDNTQVYKIYISPRSLAEANAYAKNKALDILRDFVTGDVELPFANPQILVDEGISFKADKNLGFTTLDGEIYRIDQISETFDDSGYKQSIQFETNPRFDQPKRVAPKKDETKSAAGGSIQIGSNGAFGVTNAIIEAFGRPSFLK